MDQSALLSSYHTRLNALLQRVKSIEILLMNREEEIEREVFSSWKEGKTQKLAMLQSIYDQQVAAKKEELEDLRQTQQTEMDDLHPAQEEKSVEPHPTHEDKSNEAHAFKNVELKEIVPTEEPAKAQAEDESSEDDDL